MKTTSNFETPKRLDMESIYDAIEAQLGVWPDAAARYADLGKCQRRALPLGDLPVMLQLNPARIVSTAADTSKEGIAARPCFLCAGNRPKEQFFTEWLPGWDLCINPFPILPLHFTIISREHKPQDAPPPEIAAMAEAAPDLAVFFNGAKGGASCPDHLHLQAVLKDELPLLAIAEKHHPSPHCGFMSSEDFGLDLPFHFVSAVITPDRQGLTALCKIVKAFGADPGGNEDPGLVNTFFWMGADGLMRAIVVPRRRHRPDCYFKEGEERIVVAPGAIDMTGILITPRPGDFEKITTDTLRQIYADVAFADHLPANVKKHFNIER